MQATPSIRACAVGDSFVAGAGDPECLGWIGRLMAEARAEGRDITLYNLGIRRDTSADVAVRWQTETARRLLHDELMVGNERNACCESAAIRGGDRDVEPVRAGEFDGLAPETLPTAHQLDFGFCAA